MAIDPVVASMPNDARNEESGKFASKYDDSVFLDALDTLGETGAPEVAAEVDCDYDTALRRLSSLSEQGMIDRRRVARSILWSLSEESDP